MPSRWNDSLLWNISVIQNVTETANGGQGQLDEVVEVVVIVIMSSIAVIGFQGNLSVAVVIINNPCLRTSMTNLFVLNLVIVDLLACVLAMPLAIVAFSVRNSNHDIQVCEVSGFFSTSFMLCSMLTLCVISMDRFYSIAMPLHHAAHSTPLIALVVVVVVWLVGILVACLPCLGLNSYKFKHKERICSFEWAGDKNDRAFVITIFIISFLVPSLVILSMYSSIFCIARKAARTVAPQISESTHSTIVNTEPDVNRAENSHNPVNAREIVVSTITTPVERKSHIKRVSLPSGDTQHNMASINGCQRGFLVSYSSSPNDITITNEEIHKATVNGTIPLQDPATNSSAFDRLKQSDEISPTSSTQQNQQSISILQPTNSRLINCDQEYCKRHPSDNNAGRFCCHCTTQMNFQNRQIVSGGVKHLPTAKAIHTDAIIPENNTASSSGGNSIQQETFDQHLQTIGAKSPKHSQPTLSIIQTQKPDQPSSVNSRPKHNKAFRTVMVIVLSYLLLWGPYFLCQVHQSRGGSVSPRSQLIVSWLGFTSYTVHPFLYGGMNRLIRDELYHLYRSMLTWIKALVFCLCWSCCRCCTCIDVTKEIFTTNGEEGNKYVNAVLYCMPWLREEEEEEEEGGDNENELSEMPGRGRKRRRKRGGDDDQDEGMNDNDRTESFFQFLQRTQDEDSHVPESLVIEDHSAT